jgi:GGDEF domain-containing protein
VLYCDLDGFKAVNDAHGHGAGDEVLRVVAARLVEQVRDGDAVARLGGDEFVIVAERVNVTEAADLAGRIEACLAAPMHIGGVRVQVTVSIGIAALNSAALDSAALDSVAPDNAAPDRAAPDRAAPDSAAPEGVGPKGVGPKGVGPPTGASVEALLHAADTAMYQAKAQGRNGHHIHGPRPAAV